jgi:predicted esterase
MGDLGQRCRLVFLNAPKREISCYPGETPVESAWHDYFTDHGGAGGRPEIEEDIDQNHLAEARKLIHAEIDKEAEKFGGDYRRVALFGESQGGCTALDAATTHPKTIGGVFCSFGQLYSCTPISARSARDLKIVFWHGSRDKTIAASLCLRSAARLLDRGAKKLTLHIEDGLEHCQGSDSEAQCLRKALENWGFLSGQPETAPEPKSSPVRQAPPTPPSIIKPPGLTPPPRPPRSERATPDPTPPGFSRQQISRDDVEEDVRALIASADRDEVAVSHISGLYRRKYGRMLDYKSLGFAKMTAFVAEIPGLELVNGAAGGSVRLAQAAPHRMIYDDETDSELEGYA